MPVDVKSVGHRICKIRWKPQQGEIVTKNGAFVAGSNRSGSRGSVLSLWMVKDLTQSGEGEGNVEWSCVQKVPFSGQVTDITYLSEGFCAAASENGSVYIYRHGLNGELQLARTYLTLHHYRIPYTERNQAVCTGLAGCNDQLVTVGEDGRINIIDINYSTPLRIIDDADPYTMNAVKYVSSTEVAVANSESRVSIWDVRSPGLRPNKILDGRMTTNEPGITCLDVHPSQSHVIACGCVSATVSFWDLRGTSDDKINAINSHSACVTDVQFVNANNLVTASLDGRVFSWKGEASNSNSWLMPQHLQVYDVLERKLPFAVTSVACQGQTLVCSGSNESLYIVTDIDRDIG